MKSTDLKTKVLPILPSSLAAKASKANELNELKSLRPRRSYAGARSLRPKIANTAQRLTKVLK